MPKNIMDKHGIEEGKKESTFKIPDQHLKPAMGL
jgi:hypothetical protein